MVYQARSGCALLLGFISFACFVLAAAPEGHRQSIAYLGFDRNQYPGDVALVGLRNTFRFASYWLNNPPGETANTWTKKRPLLKSQGFGFLLLFTGRKYEQLKAPADAVALGSSDAEFAIKAARAEGFPLHSVIFLDHEEGGRLLPEQRAYVHAWVDKVNSSGYRAGVYCSGVPFTEGSGETVVTADDIRQNAGKRAIVYWVVNDSCPPSPGCAMRNASPHSSGLDFASVWQFAQSPRRPQFASGCMNYAGDGNCYAPGTSIFVDLNTADSPDPSHGR
jgi:hypothetical protein